MHRDPTGMGCNQYRLLDTYPKLEKCIEGAAGLTGTRLHSILSTARSYKYLPAQQPWEMLFAQGIHMVMLNMKVQ